MTADPPRPPPSPVSRSPMPTGAHALARPTVVQIASEALFAGAQEVQILHDGSVYRLKRTTLGKLILTK